MKTVHIISHSHWDREWYLPYERHHMLLVELIDDVLDLFKQDPNFKSFYLDGQTIILDDYLQVRPEKKEEIQRYITNGQLKIGPFYILQDAFLTSSESNVRNMLIGHQESLKWNEKTEIGYYPDTFGNVGQTPQLMKQLGFDLAAFGRGVKPTGFANQSSEDNNFVSSYSEMNWEGVDGSTITGLLFANWYSNGNEIPTNKEEAEVYWTQKLKDAERYASTDQLLFLNGCDHQPVQKDLSQALKVANELFDDYAFIHSDFTSYIESLKSELPEDLDKVTGELTSQETEGWYTLTNTASSRVYLKQKNAQIARLLENSAEPLATMAYDISGDYPHDVLDYAWKTYMQNHPHDSICGCSIDTVHDEMETRFQKAENVAEYVIDDALNTLSEAVNTEKDLIQGSVPFIVFNTAGIKRSTELNTTVELDPIYFHEKFPSVGYTDLLEEKLPTFKVVDKDGIEMQSSISTGLPNFNYDLPKDKFRQPYMTRKVNVELYIENIEPFSWQTYYLIPVETQLSEKKDSVKDQPTKSIENSNMKVTIEEDGSVTLHDKSQNKSYYEALVYEDTGDIGNEYVYKCPDGETPITSIGKLSDVQIIDTTPYKQEIEMTHVIDIPVSADEQLLEEQNKVVEFRNRRSQRVVDTQPLEIKTVLSLEKGSDFVKIRTILTNEMKDHRIRVRFKTGISSDYHYADTIFETVKRPNAVSDAWTNPENPQRLHHFVNICDSEMGMVLSPDGLNEYEVIEEEGQLSLALTLFRSVGEMGDWGYFPTPGAQVLGRAFEFDYAVGFHGKDDRVLRLKQAKHLFVPLLSMQTDFHKGQLAKSDQYLNVTGDEIAVTALKRNRATSDPVTRLYNMTSETADYTLKINHHNAVKSTILEESGSEETVFKAEPFEIITHIWKKEAKE